MNPYIVHRNIELKVEEFSGSNCGKFQIAISKASPLELFPRMNVYLNRSYVPLCYLSLSPDGV